MERLPTELLICIFYECPLDIAARLKLAHVCPRWAFITRETPSLWTHIEIKSNYSWNTASFERFRALLGMQLDRSANQLLDITWIYDATTKYRNDIFLWMVEHAPCERWRSLELTVRGQPDEGELSLAKEQSFTNLEYFHPISVSLKSIVQAIEHTESNKLRRLDLRFFRQRIPDIYTTYSRILTRISRLDLPRHSFATEPPLPQNITTLRARMRSVHIFPHIHTYDIGQCIFESTSNVDLQRLTSLSIVALLDIAADCQVTLPALRHLTYRKIHLAQDARIDTPMLETLHVRGYVLHSSQFDKTLGDAVEATVSHPGYTFSPTKALTLEIDTPTTGILQLLAKCPNVEEVTLTFHKGQTAIETLNHIMGASSSIMGDQKTTLATEVCPRMRVLRLSFIWEISEVEAWREKVVQSMRLDKPELGTGMEVFAMWKGEGSYVRLA